MTNCLHEPVTALDDPQFRAILFREVRSLISNMETPRSEVARL